MGGNQSDLNQHLVTEEIISTDMYDPYKCPPNIQLCYIHQKANFVGLVNLDSKNICPCCNNKIDRVQLNLYSNYEELSTLGFAYPLYFQLLLNLLIIVTLLFILSVFPLRKLGLIQDLFYEEEFNVIMEQEQKYSRGIITLQNQNYQQIELEIISYITGIETFIIILWSILIKINYFQQVSHKFREQHNIYPSSNSVLLQNLPTGVKSSEIYEFIKKKFGKDIIKINLIYDIMEYKQNYKLILKKIFDLNNVKIQMGKNNDKEEPYFTENQISKLNLIQKIEVLSQKLKNFQNSCNYETSCISALITFKEQSSQKDFLKNYEFKSISYFINKVKSKIQYLDKDIICRAAPLPEDIIWKNLKFSFGSQFYNIFWMNIIIITIIAISNIIKYHEIIQIYQYFDNENISTMNFWIAVETSFTNIIILLMVEIMIKNYQPISNTIRIQKIKNYTFNYIIINSIIIPEILSIFIINNDQQDYFRDYSNYFVLTHITFQIIHQLLNFKIISKLYNRYKIQKQFLFNLQIIKRTIKTDCPYPQHLANMYFQNRKFKISRSLSYLEINMAIIFFFLFNLEFKVYIQMVILLIVYFWQEKIYLLRISSVPNYLNENLYDFIYKNIEYLSLIFFLGAILQQITQNDGVFNLFYNYPAYIIALSIILIYIFICQLWEMKRQKKYQNQENTDNQQYLYERAQIQFENDYGQSNPISRYLNDIKIHGNNQEFKGIGKKEKNIFKKQEIKNFQNYIFCREYDNWKIYQLNDNKNDGFKKQVTDDVKSHTIELQTIVQKQSSK